MKNLALVLGISGVVALSLWSCGSDVSGENGDGGSTSSSSGTGGNGTGGGSGGATTTTSSSSSSSSTTSSQDCDSTPCAAACCHVDGCFPGGCDLLAGYLPGFETCEEQAGCASVCVTDADCAAIATLVGGTPDPDLMDCLLGCQGAGGGGGGSGCVDCAQASCLNQVMACQGSTECQAFAQCALNCTPGDPSCINDCATSNPSAETTDLLDCMTTNCSDECLGTGGAGGN